MSNSVNTSKNDSAIESKSKDISNSSLPLSRIRVIMKSLPDVNNITPEALLLVTKSTVIILFNLFLVILSITKHFCFVFQEMFIKYLTEKSKRHITGKTMEYKHMVMAVGSEEKLEFMTEVMPKKLTVKEVREQLQNESDSSQSDEEGEEEEAEEEEDESEDDEEASNKSVKSEDVNEEGKNCVVIGD